MLDAQKRKLRDEEVPVRVVIRCKPPSRRPESRGDDGGRLSFEIRANELQVFDAAKKTPIKTYAFDGICDTTTDQEQLFQSHVIPIVEEVLLGFNCTIFAYGQTGTGKTYTMEGEWTRDLGSEPATPIADNAERPTLPAKVGIIPRALALIFARLQEMRVEWNIRVSFLEIYNEELIDLLQNNTKQPLRIYDSGLSSAGYSSGAYSSSSFSQIADSGSIVKNLTEIAVKSLPEVYNILTEATKKRKTAETLLNHQSSRSHSIFTILVTMKELGSQHGSCEEIIRVGKLNLVDLAGSENIQRSGTDKNTMRTKEAGIINQSLVTLGRVINSLATPSNYVPYRDSKLTRLLQDSLGGKTKTCIIATIDSSLNMDETLSTLDYAHRAKHIKNKPEVNQKMTQKYVVQELHHEIQRLRKELALQREKTGEVYLDADVYADIEEQLRQFDELRKSSKTLVESLDATKEQLTEMTQRYDFASKSLEMLSADYRSLRDVYSSLLEDFERKTKSCEVASECLSIEKLVSSSVARVLQDCKDDHEELAQRLKLLEAATYEHASFTKETMARLVRSIQQLDVRDLELNLFKIAGYLQQVKSDYAKDCQDIMKALKGLQSAVEDSHKQSTQAFVNSLVAGMSSHLQPQNLVNDLNQLFLSSCDRIFTAASNLLRMTAQGMAQSLTACCNALQKCSDDVTELLTDFEENLLVTLHGYQSQMYKTLAPWFAESEDEEEIEDSPILAEPPASLDNFDSYKQMMTALDSMSEGFEERLIAKKEQLTTQIESRITDNMAARRERLLAWLAQEEQIDRALSDELTQYVTQATDRLRQTNAASAQAHQRMVDRLVSVMRDSYENVTLPFMRRSCESVSLFTRRLTHTNMAEMQKQLNEITAEFIPQTFTKQMKEELPQALTKQIIEQYASPIIKSYQALNQHQMSYVTTELPAFCETHIAEQRRTCEMVEECVNEIDGVLDGSNQDHLKYLGMLEKSVTKLKSEKSEAETVATQVVNDMTLSNVLTAMEEVCSREAEARQHMPSLRPLHDLRRGWAGTRRVEKLGPALADQLIDYNSPNWALRLEGKQELTRVATEPGDVVALHSDEVLVALVEGELSKALPTVKGVVVSYENSTQFASGGVTVIDNQPTGQRQGEILLLANDVLQAVTISPPAENAEVPDVEESSLDAALQRQSDSLRSHVPLGVNVTSAAQAMFDKFYKQLPKDTRWSSDGSQDLVVLGVRVKFPYAGDCCEPNDPAGHKSLKRIRDMVANFAKK